MAADPKLVVSLEARLDKFEAQLKQAGVVAERTVDDIEQKFARANPSFAPTFLGNLLGNLAGQAIPQGIRLITDLVDRFRELEKASKLAGVGMNEVFGLQEAANKLKAPVEDVTKSVRALAVLLDQMKRGEDNSLSKLFDANPAALKDINRETLTWQQAMEIVADLVRNARTEVQKIDLARAAGQTETMVPLLERGGTALRTMQKAAADTAPDLQRIANLANDFDELWTAAVKRVKAALVEGLVVDAKAALTELADFALKFLALFKGGLLEGVAERAAEKWAAFREEVQKLGVAAEKAARETAKAGNLPGGGTTSRDPNAPLSNVAPKTAAGTEGKDAFERQVDTINKHIAAMEADAEAVGKTAGEHERLKVEAQLTEALLRGGIEINDQYAEAMTKIADAAAKTADTLDKRKTAFTEFLSGARDLSSGLSEAFKGMVLEGKKFDEVLKNLVGRLASRSIDKLFELLLLGGPKGTGGLLGSLFGAFGGARAEGGPVSAGKTYLVGERGRELFVPRVPGTIVPHDVTRRGLSGSSIQNIFNVAGEVSQASVDRLERMVMRTNRVVTQQGRGMASAQHLQRTGVSLG